MYFFASGTIGPALGPAGKGAASIPSTFIPSFETAARSLKVVPIIAPVHSNEEIETAIIALGREPGRRPCRHAGFIHERASRADHIGSRPKQCTSGLCGI